MFENNNNRDDGCLNWDDQISDENNEKPVYEPLPAGDYDFVIEEVKRGIFPGSNKPGGLPECPKVTLTLGVTTADGKQRKVWTDLFMHKRCEWVLSQLFTSIGMKKEGEPFKMDWNIVGKTGRAHITVSDPWVGRDGVQRQSNRVAKYLLPSDKPDKTEFKPLPSDFSELPGDDELPF